MRIALISDIHGNLPWKPFWPTYGSAAVMP